MKCKLCKDTGWMEDGSGTKIKCPCGCHKKLNKLEDKKVIRILKSYYPALYDIGVERGWIEEEKDVKP